MNSQRYFQRKEDYAPPTTPPKSPFRSFKVSCLQCGSFVVKPVMNFDEETGDETLVLACG